MATLVLTHASGTALGGPIGGALGSIVGQSIDQQSVRPPARRGPRLGDLRVQTSSYGTPIPRHLRADAGRRDGRLGDRPAEEEVASGGGKGAPGAISYAYSASFAVALSSRAAQSVGRIWADGKLLRGADGDFKTKVKHPLLSGERGPAGRSADRVDRGRRAGRRRFAGMALAVFEDLALADYGNRIPSLTFEIDRRSRRRRASRRWSATFRAG